MFDLKDVGKEELVVGLREAVDGFNSESRSHRFGLILFGSRARGTYRINSDVDYFHIELTDCEEGYTESVRRLDDKIDAVLLRWGIVNPAAYHYSIARRYLLSALEDESYRREILEGRVGFLDKYSLYIGPDEEENRRLLENSLRLSEREVWIGRR